MTSPRDESPIATNSSLHESFLKKRVLFIFGTRPEAIKLCPLLTAFQSWPSLAPIICVTGQHRELVDSVLQAFSVKPQYHLDLMQPAQSPSILASRILHHIQPVLNESKPSLVVVQGDTMTAFAGALASFYARAPVAHVEAGLRTFDFDAPFPEEMNRVLIGRLARLHFAPTEQAAENLRREGVKSEAIRVTGNTGIDAILSVRDGLAAGRLAGSSLPIDPQKKLIVITAHRRENFGAGLLSICEAVQCIASRHDVQIVWPVHPNPSVRAAVNQKIANTPNIVLAQPLDYVPFVDLLQRAYLIITDSGGIQEEGPSLGKPILVLREKTERPEGVAAGTVKLVGCDPSKIVRETARLLDNRAEYEQMSARHNPYGDGKASVRIAETIASFLGAELRSNDDLLEQQPCI